MPTTIQAKAPVSIKKEKEKITITANIDGKIAFLTLIDTALPDGKQLYDVLNERNTKINLHNFMIYYYNKSGNIRRALAYALASVLKGYVKVKDKKLYLPGLTTSKNGYVSAANKIEIKNGIIISHSDVEAKANVKDFLAYLYWIKIIRELNVLNSELTGVEKTIENKKKGVWENFTYLIYERPLRTQKGVANAVRRLIEAVNWRIQHGPWKEKEEEIIKISDTFKAEILRKKDKVVVKIDGNTFEYKTLYSDDFDNIVSLFIALKNLDKDKVNKILSDKDKTKELIDWYLSVIGTSPVIDADALKAYIDNLSQASQPTISTQRSPKPTRETTHETTPILPQTTQRALKPKRKITYKTIGKIGEIAIQIAQDGKNIKAKIGDEKPLTLKNVDYKQFEKALQLALETGAYNTVDALKTDLENWEGKLDIMLNGNKIQDVSIELLARLYDIYQSSQEKGIKHFGAKAMWEYIQANHNSLNWDATNLAGLLRANENGIANIAGMETNDYYLAAAMWYAFGDKAKEMWNKVVENGNLKVEREKLVAFLHSYRVLSEATSYEGEQVPEEKKGAVALKEWVDQVIKNGDIVPLINNIDPQSNTPLVDAVKDGLSVTESSIKLYGVRLVNVKESNKQLKVEEIKKLLEEEDSIYKLAKLIRFQSQEFATNYVTSATTTTTTTTATQKLEEVLKELENTNKFIKIQEIETGRRKLNAWGWILTLGAGYLLYSSSGIWAGVGALAAMWYISTHWLKFASTPVTKKIREVDGEAIKGLIGGLDLNTLNESQKQQLIGAIAKIYENAGKTNANKLAENLVNDVIQSKSEQQKKEKEGS